MCSMLVDGLKFRRGSEAEFWTTCAMFKSSDFGESTQPPYLIFVIFLTQPYIWGQKIQHLITDLITNLRVELICQYNCSNNYNIL